MSIIEKLKVQDQSDDFLVGGMVQELIYDRTIKRMCLKFNDISSTEGIELEKVTKEMALHQQKQGSSSSKIYSSVTVHYCLQI